MRLRNVTIAINTISLSVLLLLSCAPDASAFNETDLLTREIKATTIKSKTIHEIADVLAVDYQVPIGIELGDPKLTPDRSVDLDLPQTTLKGFLDSLIAEDTRYTWKLEGGVVHIWPVNARDTFVASVLDAKISHFAMTGGTTRYKIFNDILNIPEISSQLVIADVSPMIFLNFGSMHKLEKDTFFSESNLTLRELLDRIVLKTDIKRWVITRWGEHNEYITLRS